MALDKETIRGKLLERQAQIRQRIFSLERDKRREQGPLEKNLEEQAIAIENDEVVDALDEVERRSLVQVKQALDRIDSEDWGVCVTCGDQISDARLMSLPYALECIHCASQSVREKRERR